MWEGNLFPGGRSQSVYSLNTSELTAVPKADGSPLLIRLAPGQTYELPGGRGSITFDSVSRFAGLSVRTDPGKGMTLIASLLTIAGLVTSLLVRRRRVFVRAQPDPSDPSTTLVTIGGLSKTADPGLAAVLDGLVAELSGRSPGAALAAHPERT